MKFFSYLLNLLFPPQCASCKKEGDFLCRNCVYKLKIKRIKIKSISPSKLDFSYLDGVIYGLDFAENPEIQAALHQFKYKFTQDLVSYFGDLVADKVKQLKMVQNREIQLIPVPLHKKRLNQRGFNQAELIANSVQERVGDRVQVSHLLKRDRNTAQQAKLNKYERQKNLQSAFSLNCSQINPKLEDRNSKEDLEPVYFVVDDVCTTGATLDNCAKTLKEAGIGKVYGLVVARAFK